MQAKQGWYRRVVEALDAGRSVAESIALLERFLERVTDPLHADSLAALRSADGWIHQQAAAEARSYLHRYPDADIHLEMKRAIRLDPFTIHRSSAPV